MLIKFVKPDPRAGDVVRLDSHRAQQFIDEGRAEQVPESSAAAIDPAATATAPAAKATAPRKPAAAKK